LIKKLPEPILTETGTLSGYTLQQMAEASGGQVIIGQIENNLLSKENLGRAQDAVHTGFTSTNAAKVGKWRSWRLR
jgi:hypothetical protein